MSAIIKELYAPGVRLARARVDEDPGIRTLLDPGIDPILLLRFLIAYNASGVYMTRPVDGWIRRAGERCAAMADLSQIGATLIAHAEDEAGHHLLMVKDTKRLVERWNARHTPELSADRLLDEPMLAATKEFVDLHEDTIAGDSPFGQLAIEFEIERISLTLFTRLVENWKRVLRPEIMTDIGFIKLHVEIDVDHAEINDEMMDRLLTARPSAAEILGRIGSRAVDIYVAFLNECLRKASLALAGDRA